MMRFTERAPVYLPLKWPLWTAFFFIFLLAYLFVQVLTAGLAKLGFDPSQVLFLLMATFFGSAINIPIKRYCTQRLETIALPSFFGMSYAMPVFRRRECTVLAVNVGGCVVPTLVSIYLVSKMPQMLPAALVCVVACAFATFRMSRVIPGVGIGLPFFAAPLISALLAVLLSPSDLAAPVAYVTGSLGTLIGADLMNLRKIATMGAPVASIGGAGTWDGIFLSGVLASVLAF